MYRYFIEGGPLFMGMLSLVLLAILIMTIINGKAVLANTFKNLNQRRHHLGNIKSLGLFALVLGMLGQFLGLFQAFKIIGSGIEISPAIMASGIKVSMVTSIYGMIIFLISYLFWFVLKALAARQE
jgi:biopolymer transport protein ExbB/TolQ